MLKKKQENYLASWWKMQIEIDVLEMVVLIITVYAAKWGFRLLFVAVIAKLIQVVKDKAVGAVDDVKRQFTGYEQTRKDSEHDK